MSKRKSTTVVRATDEKRAGDTIYKALQQFIAHIPASRVSKAADPLEKSRAIINKACLKAAGAAGALAIPPGPLGFITILPDLISIWKIQRQMVVDVAATFGKDADITQSQMIYCLFRHSAGQAVRDLATRVGGRIIMKRTSLRFIQQALRKIGIRVLQRTTAKAISRWLPVVGVIGIGAYAYLDTAQVGKNAIDLFSKTIVIED